MLLCSPTFLQVVRTFEVIYKGAHRKGICIRSFKNVTDILGVGTIFMGQQIIVLVNGLLFLLSSIDVKTNEVVDISNYRTFTKLTPETEENTGLRKTLDLIKLLRFTPFTQFLGVRILWITHWNRQINLKKLSRM